MSRRSFQLIVMVFLISACAVSFCANTYQSPSIPIYPGGKVTTRMTLTDKDFLPMINGFITGVQSSMSTVMKPQSNGDAGVGANSSTATGMSILGLSKIVLMTDVSKILKDLKSVSMVQYGIGKTPPERVGDFYKNQFGYGKNWTNNFTYQEHGETFLVYTKPDLTGIFFVTICPKEVVAIRSEGKIDGATIGNLAGKLVPMVLHMRDIKYQQVTMQEQDKKNAETQTQEPPQQQPITQEQGEYDND